MKGIRRALLCLCVILSALSSLCLLQPALAQEAADRAVLRSGDIELVMLPGEPALNNDTVSYRELRAGGGARWQFSRALQLTVEGGYAWDRRFQFNRSNVLLNGDGAPYLGITLSGSY